MAILQELRVHAFRNLQDQRLVFEPGLTVLAGANGQGKTNLLEAIFFLGLLRSFRTPRIAHLLQFDKDAFAVEGLIRTADDLPPVRLQVRHGDRRKLSRAGEPVHRATDYLGTLHCVPIVPEDIELVKGSGRLRRQYLDVTLAPHDPVCLQALQRYSDTLTQRNALLRTPSANGTAALDAFDAILIPAGAELVARRHRFIQDLDAEIQALLPHFAGDTMPVAIRYQPGFTTDPAAPPETIANDLRASLARARERDLRYGFSHTGPHRDDFRISLAGRPLAEVGSEGQCRLTAILLRLAAARVLARHNSPPVVLVDDVVGELDRSRRMSFLRLLSELPQVFLACTDAADVTEFTHATRFTVSNGAVEPV